ncbi:MAG: acetylornithine/succinylornithine family transaminase [Puniceicoccales bacterium]|jgi:acetylornithine aminotransferase/acetylornithine/N-succinyldiaminopimelate aminotransferase|nr:acetylornithine/succinylornithine family transaminase [Puniceicoccales bacterium]
MSETTDAYARFLLGNYAPPALTLVRGEGSYVFDNTGRRYLDFCSGIAVNALGHAHPRWLAAVNAQAATLAHSSNLFRNEKQAELARTLAELVEAGGSGAGRLLFCNSGAEANEALLKLARLHGKKKAGAEGVAYKVLVAENAFHGRTFGAMSATPQEKIQKGFRPMLDGFEAAPLNDLAAFERRIGADTAAVLVEAIQGESGLSVATPEFLRGLRALCDKHDALLLFDEVQSGIGRTGKFLAFQHSGVRADAFSLAKGLGGGFPIGAIWVAQEHAGLFTPGSHGTTFGGNPLACAAALAVLGVVRDESLLEKIAVRSAVWRAELGAVVARFPAQARAVRGVGYLSGVEFCAETPPFAAALREAGLLVVPAGGNVLRFLPPLTVSEPELAESVAILAHALGQKS